MSNEQPTCGTCKYRGPEIFVDDWANDIENIPTGFFQCDRIKHVHIYPDAPLSVDAKAFVVDGSDYFGQLRVAADFGCVEHKPND